MNFANVRSAIGALSLAVALLAAAAADAGGEGPAGPPSALDSRGVTVALLPGVTSAQDLEPVAGLATGLLVTGPGEVSQARLLAEAAAGDKLSDEAFAERSDSLVRRSPGGFEEMRFSASGPASRVVRAAVVRTDLSGLAHLIADRPARGLVIAVGLPRRGPFGEGARGVPEGQLLPVGIAGRGFEGVLRSPSTRMGGLVLSTDLAPTVLAERGLDAPREMSGRPIEAVGGDRGSLGVLQDRLEEIGSRRGTVLGLVLLAWLTIGAAAFLTEAVRGGGIWPRTARVLCLSLLLLPLPLMGIGWTEPSLAVEAAVAAVLPLGAALSLGALLRGWLPLGVACLLTVAGFALDMVFGSPLTPLSLVGSNPAIGSRFYGIGNELEAVLIPMALAGAGALLASRARIRPADPSTNGHAGDPAERAARRGAAAFASVGAACAIVFGLGRFGADVGAIVAFPLGAAVAAAFVLGRPRWAWAGVGAAAAALLLVGVADLFSGGESHFARTILGEGSESGGDALLRRLGEAGESFVRLSRLPLLALALGLIGLWVLLRREVAGWLEGADELRAGLIGSAAAIAAGTVMNDSGATILELGVVYASAVLAFAWARSALESPRSATKSQ